MFETLLSNKNMKEQLSRAAAADKPLHAYMFCGAAGSGKKTAALAFAAEIVGGDRSKAERGTHPDIIFVRPEDGKRTITVDAVRNMRADAFVTPTEGRRKIYIIDGAHLMGEAGQNALLTVLEQPPSFSVFILLTESRQLMLETVISRCSVFDMEYVEPSEGVSVLRRELSGFTDAQLETFMRASSGNIGYAIRLASDDGYLKNVELSEKVALSMARGDSYTVAGIITRLSKDALIAFLAVFTVYLRDITVKNATGSAESLVFSDSVLKNSAVFDKMNINKLYGCINACMSARSQLEASISQMLVAAELSIHLCGGNIN